MNAKHTPGPWKTVRPHSTIYIEARLRGSTIQEVASCGPTEMPEQQEANARLIAAAPELLAELIKAVALINNLSGGLTYRSAAIAKATRDEV